MMTKGKQVDDRFTPGATPAVRQELIDEGLVRQAEAPRDPTPAERRRVQDELYERYDVKAEQYLESWSDDSVARRLDVPRRWVEDVRKLFFGEGSGCANDSKIDTQLASLEARIDGALRQLGDFRKEINAIRAERSKKP